MRPHFTLPYLPPHSYPQIELLARVSTLLLRIHLQQLGATPSARPLVAELQQLLRTRLQEFKDMLGFNIAGLTHLQRLARERGAVPEPPLAVTAAAAVLPLKRKAAKAAQEL